MIVLIPVQSDAEGAKRAIFAARLRSASHESIEPRAYSTGPKVTCE
jgi:cation transporter-like permease